MEQIVLYGVLLLIAAAAILVVISDKLLTAVIYGGILSAFAAFCYVLLAAPDVALAEAVIGTTLSTIIYLVTLKKYRVFNIFYVEDSAGSYDRLKKVLALIEQVLKEHEIESHMIQSAKQTKPLSSQPESDLVVEQKGEYITIHGEEESLYIHSLKHRLSDSSLGKYVKLKDSMEEKITDYKENHEG